MSRLIDADELKRYINDCDFCNRCPDASPRCQIDCEMPDFLTKRWGGVIDAQPTADAQAEINRLNRLGLTWYDTILKLMEMVNGAEPVRHGKWIDEGQYADFFPHHAWRCSECGEHVIEIDTPWYRYCPSCGAKMDAQEDEE